MNTFGLSFVGRFVLFQSVLLQFAGWLEECKLQAAESK